jgi:hypothetical protein
LKNWISFARQNAILVEMSAVTKTKGFAFVEKAAA